MEQTILLAGLPPELETALRSTLAELALRRVSDATQRPTLAVVSVERDVPSAVRLVQTLSTAGTRAAVVGPSKDAELLLLVMRAGAREFALSSDVSAVDVAVRNLARPNGTPVTGGSVTALFSAKGGMGATSVAANLAGALAGRDERVCLVDLDLELGDVPALLDVSITYSLGDVVDNMHRLDRNLLDASVVRHRSGVAVLARGDRIEEASRIEPAQVARLLGFLRQHYGYVLVDGLHGFGDLALAALDASDQVLLLATQEVAAVRNAQRCLEIFRRLGYPETKVKLVLNRYHKGSRITKEVVAETTGAAVAATIANDFALLNRAVNRGNLLPEEAPRSNITADIAALGTLVGGSTDMRARAGSVFSRLFSSRGAATNGT